MDWMKKNPAARQLHLYRHNAKQKGLVFELTLTDFESVKQKECHYCGYAATGFDRIDSDSGYIRSNIAPCCVTCNRAKRDSTRRAFLAMCHRIVRRHPMTQAEINQIESHEQVLYMLSHGEF